MNIRKLILKEIRHRKLNFFLGVLATVIATASLIGSIVLLRAYDIRTGRILLQKEAELQARMDQLQDDTRKAMLLLGFNLVILPKEQNLADWHAQDYSDKYMPESYVDVLANSDIMSVQHLLPSLQQKVLWPERHRTIILVGTRGEVPKRHGESKKPLQQAVPPGYITLGHGLHASMNIRLNERVKLMGRTFVVNKCLEERGNKDDITAWIHLREAQDLLGKKGLINAILALECLCTGNALPTIREEIAAILPGTQVIERESQALARAEARKRVAREAETAIEKEKQGREILRRERQRTASVLLPVILLACALWVAFMGFINVRSRREEIGVLRTMGISSGSVFALFLGKHVLIGILGGAGGLVLGVLLGLMAGGDEGRVPLGALGNVAFWTGTAALAVIGAALLAVIAGWIPAVIASRQDPAEVLREE